jgi:hypothetical protein
MTDDRNWQELFAAAGLATRPWPLQPSGTMMGWQLQPITLSADGRSAALPLPPPQFPRLYKTP